MISIKINFIELLLNSKKVYKITCLYFHDTDISRRYMAEILPIRRKTVFQSMNHRHKIHYFLFHCIERQTLQYIAQYTHLQLLFYNHEHDDSPFLHNHKMTDTAFHKTGTDKLGHREVHEIQFHNLQKCNVWFLIVFM